MQLTQRKMNVIASVRSVRISNESHSFLRHTRTYSGTERLSMSISILCGACSLNAVAILLRQTSVELTVTHMFSCTQNLCTAICYTYSNPYVPWCDMCGMAATMCSRFSIKFDISHSYAWCDDVIVNKLTATFVQTILFWFLNSIEIVAITVTQKDQLKSKLIQFNPVESLHVNWQCWYSVLRTIEQTISQRDQWTDRRTLKAEECHQHQQTPFILLWCRTAYEWWLVIQQLQLNDGIMTNASSPNLVWRGSVVSWNTSYHWFRIISLFWLTVAPSVWQRNTYQKRKKLSDIHLRPIAQYCVLLSVCRRHSALQEIDICFKWISRYIFHLPQGPRDDVIAILEQ